ncbi:MAG: hypothetical protein HYS81_00275 [Candidatus Aenigmatarchaeota archaeon]|nr:MAG: hypothetical protein HYS81_00275 [Candidatus Aenigmarchaeota archaeon]
MDARTETDLRYRVYSVLVEGGLSDEAAHGAADGLSIPPDLDGKIPDVGLDPEIRERFMDLSKEGVLEIETVHTGDKTEKYWILKY